MERVDMESNDVCCGKLFFAEIVEGKVVLECCTCGRVWPIGEDGRLATSARVDMIKASTDGRGSTSGTIPADS